MSDQERAFVEWLATGEIPDWRMDQLKGEAIHQAIAEMGQVESLSLPWERVLVTRLVADDDPHLYDVPLPSDDDPFAASGRRQLLCSHAMWERLRETAAAEHVAPGAIFMGIPVVIEDA